MIIFGFKERIVFTTIDSLFFAIERMNTKYMQIGLFIYYGSLLAGLVYDIIIRNLIRALRSIHNSQIEISYFIVAITGFLCVIAIVISIKFIHEYNSKKHIWLCIGILIAMLVTKVSIGLFSFQHVLSSTPHYHEDIIIYILQLMLLIGAIFVTFILKNHLSKSNIHSLEAK